MWGHEVLYADRSSKDEQIVIRLFFVWGGGNMWWGRWELKLIFSFMETGDELLHLDK
jgi:hypothetical protein